MSARKTIDRNPVLSAAGLQALVVAGINLAASFGWMTITADQLAAVNGFLALALPFVMAIFINRRVIVPDPEA